MDLFNKLPQDCIAKVISLTSPQDACRISVLGSIFRSAADSDFVWEAFMPSGYREIIARASPPPTFPTTRDLFFYLADTPLIIDKGAKSFSLEKRSGRKCYMLGYSDHTTYRSDCPTYGRFIRSLPISGMSPLKEPRPMITLWLEIYGNLSVNLLSQKTLYGVYMVFKFRSCIVCLNSSPMKISFEISGYKELSRDVWLNHRDSTNRSGIDPNVRRDGWLEIKVGEYSSPSPDDGEEVVDIINNGDLDMCLKEFTGNWDAAFVVRGIELRPDDHTII